MTKSEFTATLIRRLRNTPETGRDPIQFVLEIMCGGVTSNAIFGSKDLASPAQTQRVLIDQIGRAPPDRRIALNMIEAATGQDAPTTVCTSISGWREDDQRWLMFVTPHRTWGDNDRTIEFVASSAGVAHDQSIGACAGDVASWNAEVGDILRQSSAGIVLAGGVLSAPLLPLRMQKETFVLNMAGTSTTGKTSLLSGALSIQGPPRYASPETTLQGLRELGVEHNHLVLAVGDLNQLSPPARKAMMHRTSYEMTSGDARIVSKSVQEKLFPTTYRTIVFTSAERQSSEIGLLDRSKEVGAAARCFDLTPLLPAPMGYFDRLNADDGRGPKELVEAITNAVSRSHGEVLKAWTRWLATQNRSDLQAKLAREASRLIESEELDDALSMRIADAFAFMGAALILARKAGVLTWSKAEIRDAIRTSLRAVLERVKERPKLDPLLALRMALRKDGAVVEIAAVGKTDKEDWLGVNDPKRGLLVDQKRLKTFMGVSFYREIRTALSAENLLREQRAKQVEIGGKRTYVLILDPAARG
jgi:hypothetical protein